MVIEYRNIQKFTFTGFYHQITRSDRDMYVDVDFAAIDDYEVAMYINNTRASIKKNYVKCNETNLGKTRGCHSLGNELQINGKLLVLQHL